MDKEIISGILKPFMNAIITKPLFTLECECNFSAMIMTAKQTN